MRRLFPLGTGLAFLCALTLTLAPTASAQEPSLSCAPGPASQPFLPWLDPLSYVQVPDGGLEAGGAGWTLRGGARVVAGNEPFHVGGLEDSRSLALPMGSSATTPPLCTALLDPTVRFFARNTGSPLSTLQVDVVFDGPLGVGSLPVGVVLATSAWQPSLPLPVLANLLSRPLLGDGTTVAFRFTPRGLLGNWRIDDVYVDPFKGV
jgi:hypothetical protein